MVISAGDSFLQTVNTNHPLQTQLIFNTNALGLLFHYWASLAEKAKELRSDNNVINEHLVKIAWLKTSELQSAAA